MGKKMKCWQVFGCEEKACPVLKSKVNNCWLVSGTRCRGEIQGKFLEKMEMCLECSVFAANMNVDLMKETIDIVNSQFKRYRQRVDKRDRELENVSMDLAIGLSESFEMLQRLSSGDPTARIQITTKNELLMKLQTLLNQTAASMEEMVHQHHELAMGLCEQYDALAKIAAGDRTIRVPETSDNELIAKLGMLINKETTILTDLLEEMESTSLELALGLSENFEVLQKVAEGDLTVRAPDTSQNELLAKLGAVVNQTIANLKDSWDNLQKSNKQLEWELIERNRAERTLKENAEKYKTLTENINVGIFRNTPGSKGHFIEANSMMLKLFGFDSKEELFKNQVSSLYQNPAERKKFSQKMLAEGFVKDEELMLKKTDGTPIWGSVTAAAVTDENGEVRFYDGVIEDITDRKRAEERQQKLLEELENANKELKDFAYIVSHDLKAPLRAIGSLTDWLLNDYENAFDEDGKELLHLLTGRVRRMNELINGILQYSRIGRVEEEKSEVDLNHLVCEVIDMVSPPLNIQIEIQNELPTVMGEMTRLEQVFQNLISNAVKYNDKPEGKIKIGCASESRDWLFRVADNGPGIEKKYHDKIFQIFQTLAPRDECESTGIGLTVVKKIVETFGGEIWLESDVGAGSTFYFTLPKN